jgi:hypothetical protein
MGRARARIARGAFHPARVWRRTDCLRERVHAAIATELLKARRPKAPWAITASFSLAPLVGRQFMVVLRDPDRARELGILGSKAQLCKCRRLTGRPTWGCTQSIDVGLVLRMLAAMVLLILVLQTTTAFAAGVGRGLHPSSRMGDVDHLPCAGPERPRLERVVPVGCACAATGRRWPEGESVTFVSFVVVAFATLIGFGATIV